MSLECIRPEQFSVPRAEAPWPVAAIKRFAKLLQPFAVVLPLTLGSPVYGADTGAAPLVLPTAALSDAIDNDEDDSADYPEDGSGALERGPRFFAPKGLLPISPTEEKGLLGNWGDSATEAED